MRMLGIDPGLTCTGWGVIEQQGTKLVHLGHGHIRTTPAQPDHLRLQQIFDGIVAVCQDHGPHAASIESVFMAKNAKSALKLGMARGVAMAACSQQELPLNEIAPRLAKKAVTGSGSADKKQMQTMVSHLLGVVPKGADAADALGIAIAGIHDAANGSLLDVRQARSSLHHSGLNKDTIGSDNNRPSRTPRTGQGLAAAIQAALAKEQR